MMKCQVEGCGGGARWLIIRTCTGPVLVRFCKGHMVEAFRALMRSGAIDEGFMMDVLDYLEGMEWVDV